MTKIKIISLFPEIFEAYFKIGMLAKASELKLVEFELINLRDFGIGLRKQVDDTPYGGGGGMILRIEPLVQAIEFAKSSSKVSQVILMTPRGELFNQKKAQTLSESNQDLIFIGGRYEGYDERIIAWVDCQLSIGQFVLTGFELPALCVIDALVRLIPGVLGNEQGSFKDSFSFKDDLVEYPQYTKPEVYGDLKVPKVLLSGHHQQIETWREQQMKKI